MPLTTTEQTHLDRMTSWMANDVIAAKTAGMNVGQITLIVCRLDALASYFVGAESESSVGETEFVAFVREFLFAFASESRDTNGTDLALEVVVDRWTGHTALLDYPRILYKLVRCGLVHEHLCKPGTAIVKDYPDSAFSPPYFAKDPVYGLVINIDRLREDFLAAVVEWKRRVESDGSLEQANYQKRLAFVLWRRPSRT